MKESICKYTFHHINIDVHLRPSPFHPPLRQQARMSRESSPCPGVEVKGKVCSGRTLASCNMQGRKKHCLVATRGAATPITSPSPPPSPPGWLTRQVALACHGFFLATLLQVVPRPSSLTPPPPPPWSLSSYRM